MNFVCNILNRVASYKHDVKRRLINLKKKEIQIARRLTNNSNSNHSKKREKKGQTRNTKYSSGDSPISLCTSASTPTSDTLIPARQLPKSTRPISLIKKNDRTSNIRASPYVTPPLYLRHEGTRRDEHGSFPINLLFLLKIKKKTKRKEEEERTKE